MIYGIIAIQDRGKTLTGVAMATKFSLQGYAIYSTVALPLIEHTQLTIEEMRSQLGSMVDSEKRHVVYFVDEINRIFAAREWAKNTKFLTGLWQDEKLDVQLIYTAHTKKDPWRMAQDGIDIGELLNNMTGIDSLMREATRMVLFPYFDHKNNRIELLVHDYRFDCSYITRLRHASDWFASYDRWAVVK